MNTGLLVRSMRRIVGYVKQRGSPTEFVTSSAADDHWPDLYRLLDPKEQIDAISEHKAAKSRQELLNRNPLLVAEFFSLRTEYIVKEVMAERLDIADHSVRYEWQHRGSGHVYRLIG